MINNIPTVRTLRFIKEEDLWYADLPEFLAAGRGTKADLLMVAGADTLLELLAAGNKEVTMKISPEQFDGYKLRMKQLYQGVNKALLEKCGHAAVESGAYYLVTEKDGIPWQHRLWLCPVTEYVFDSYPNEIWAAVIH